MLAGNATITGVDTQGRNYITDIVRRESRCRRDSLLTRRINLSKRETFGCVASTLKSIASILMRANSTFPQVRIWFGRGTQVMNSRAGIPHSIQGLSGVKGQGCEFLLVFDDGNFSEDETFLVTDWIAHVRACAARARRELRPRLQVPMEVLAKSLQLEQAALAEIPSDQVRAQCVLVLADGATQVVHSCGYSLAQCPRRLQNRLSRRRMGSSPSPSAFSSARPRPSRSAAARTRSW